MLVILAGCESQVHIQVTCIDALTGSPVDSVQVNVGAGFDGDYSKNAKNGLTDSTGFLGTDMMIGCPGKCYDIVITYSKQGYETRVDTNFTSGEIRLNPVR